MKKLTTKHILGLLICALCPLSAHAAAPALYFSDLLSGPNTGLGDGLGSGAIITIWGVNLGSSQGGSTIQVGGVPAAHVYYWGNADGSKSAGPALLYNSFMNIQTVSFSVPAGAVNGANTISVTVNGAHSNTLPFTVRPGPIYWVAINGTNCTVTNPVTPGGCGSFAAPLATLTYTANSSYPSNGGYIPSGSTVYIKDGYINTEFLVISGGCSSDRTKQSGIDAIQQTFYVAYPGAKVQIARIGFNCPDLWVTTNEYRFISFSKITVMGPTDTLIDTDNHMRLVGVEVTSTPGSCAWGQSGAIDGSLGMTDGAKFLGMYVHDISCANIGYSAGYHTFYVANYGSQPPGFVIDPYEYGWNYIANSWARAAIHIYSEGQPGDFNGTLKVHDNVINNQRSDGITWINDCYDQTNWTYIVTAGIDIWNNLLVNTNRTANGEPTGDSAVNFKMSCFTGTIRFWNNTIYNTGVGSISEGALADYIYNTPKGVTPTLDFRNNIFMDINGTRFQSQTENTSAAFHTNNLWYSTAGQTAPSWDTSPITSNPMFVNPSNGLLNLQSGSPAIGAGYNASALVTTDITGAPRSVPFSIGAFQSQGSVASVPPAAPRGFALK